MIQCVLPGPAGSSLAPDAPHVLLVVDQFPKTLGGGERIVLRLAALLPHYGFRVSIVTFAIHPESSVLQGTPCPLYLLPLTRTYDANALRGAFALRTFLRTEKISIVQTFFESSDIWAGFVTRALSHAALIWSRRDMGILRDSKHRAAYRLMRRLPAAVFAVSEQVRQYTIEVDGVAAERVTTIYNGLDLKDWLTAGERPPRAGSDFQIVTVGNIRRVKGHDVMIRAATKVVAQYPQVHFSIAGAVLEEDYFAELQALVRELKLGDNFHFAGEVADLKPLLFGADIFVLPSRSEGFSNALIEAMAASLPLVATRVGGNAEAIEDNVSGLLIPPDDPGALADGMLQLVRDPEQARRMGAAGRLIAAKKFTTEAMMQQVTEIYGRLLAKR